MSGIVDFHTHAFPDSIADQALAKLRAEVPEAPCYLDGKVGSLLKSMDDAGIQISVLCCIATRPGQYESILGWCKQVASERIVPFPSIHPDDPLAVDRIRQIAAEGYRGIKMHPYYQQFVVDEAKMYPLYERMAREKLILVMHTGFDIAFERVDRAGPDRICRVVDDLPELKFVATHLGAWEQWDRAQDILVGRKVYIEISYAMEFLGVEKSKNLMLGHPAEYLLFGTDSPWDDQKACIQKIRGLGLDTPRERAMLRDNARRLLVL